VLFIQTVETKKKTYRGENNGSRKGAWKKKSQQANPEQTNIWNFGKGDYRHKGDPIGENKIRNHWP